MKFPEAIRELQYNRQNKFILSGSESFLQYQFIQTCQCLHPDVEKFIFGPGDEENLKQLLYSESLFGNRLVIIKNVQDLKIKNLPDLIKNFDGGYLFLINSSEDGRNPSSALTSVCTSVVCNKMPEYGPDYPSWISSRAAEEGYTFLQDAEYDLYHKVGADLFTLAHELKKLQIYKEATKQILPEDVRMVVSTTAQSSTYEILDFLLKGDIKQLLNKTNNYLQNSGDEGPGELVWFLGHYIEKMYKILLLNEEKMSPDDIGAILNIPGFLIKTRYLPRVLNLGKVRLAKYLSRLSSLDSKIKLFPDKKIPIFSFIFSLNSDTI
jgi:DNA polymerase III delta subunit